MKNCKSRHDVNTYPLDIRNKHPSQPSTNSILDNIQRRTQLQILIF